MKLFLTLAISLAATICVQAQTDTLYFQDFEKLTQSDRWFFNLSWPASGYYIENGKGMMSLPSDNINISVPVSVFSAFQNIRVTMTVHARNDFDIDVFVADQPMTLYATNVITSQPISPETHLLQFDLYFHETLNSSDYVIFKFYARNTNSTNHEDGLIEIDDFLIRKNDLVTGTNLHPHTTSNDPVLYYIDLNGKILERPLQNQAYIAIYESGRRKKHRITATSE